MEKTHYETLGLEPTATPTEISGAYRKAARKLHPDINPDADQNEMAAISAAYSILSKPASRAKYDQELVKQKESSSAHKLPAPVVEGLDYRLAIAVDSKQAAAGVTRPITVTFPQPCLTCKGTSFDQATLTKSCVACNGSKYRADGSMCGYCAGAGKISDNPCSVCEGKGSKVHQEILEITVPAETYENRTIRLPRKGVTDFDGKRKGHVLVDVHLTGDKVEPEKKATPQARFGKELSEFHIAANGLDVGLSVQLSYPELRRGCTMSVADIKGTVHTLTVAAGTAPGTVLKVAGGGKESPSGQAADLHVLVGLWMPQTTPTAEETLALLALERAMKEMLEKAGE